MQIMKALLWFCFFLCFLDSQSLSMTMPSSKLKTA